MTLVNCQSADMFLAPRWWASGCTATFGMPDFTPKEYSCVFAGTEFHDATSPNPNYFNTQWKMSGANLGIDALNSMLSVLAALLERYGYAYFGSNSSEFLNCMPCHEMPRVYLCDGSRWIFDALKKPCRRLQMSYNQRNLMLTRFQGLLQDLLKDYAGAALKMRPFGYLYPAGPFHGSMPDWSSFATSRCTMGSILSSLAVRSGCTGAIFSDITQRTMCKTLNFDTLLRFSDSGCGTAVNFHCHPDLWRPALRHVRGLLCSLATNSSQRCVVSSWWNCLAGSENVMCTLSCNYVDEPMQCWQTMMDEFDIAGCHYCHYFKIGTRNRKYNPMAVSLAMALLASFAKYQILSLDMSIGRIKHTCQSYYASFKPYWNSSTHCWCICKEYAADTSVVQYQSDSVGRAKFGIGWCVQNAQLNVGDSCHYEYMVLMHDCRDGDRSGSEFEHLPGEGGCKGAAVYCYFRCQCYDKPYRTESQLRWHSVEKTGDCRLQCSVMHMFRYRPSNYDGDASATNNGICLSSPSEQYPAAGRMFGAYNFQPVRYDYHPSEDASPTEGWEPQFGMLQGGSEGTPPLDWARDSAFSMFNGVMLRKEQEEYIGNRLASLGYCDFGGASGFRRTICKGFMGYGDMAASILKGCLAGYTPTEGGGGPGARFYDRVRYEPSESVGHPDGWYGGTLQADGTYDEIVLVAHADPSVRTGAKTIASGVSVDWAPEVCGDSGVYWQNGVHVSDYVQFGGYFQIIDWDFYNLKIKE